MTPSWTTIFVLQFGVWVCVLGQDCRLQKLGECYHFLDTNLQTGSFVAAQTKEDLHTFCWDLNYLMTCTINFKMKCVEGFDGIRTIVSELRPYLDKLCSLDSPLVQEYLRHASCFTRAESKMKNCTEKAASSYQRIQQFRDERSRYEALKTFCRHHAQSFVCVHAGYRRECGIDATRSSYISLDLFDYVVQKTLCSTVDHSEFAIGVGMSHHSSVALVSSAAMFCVWWRRH